MSDAMRDYILRRCEVAGLPPVRSVEEENERVRVFAVAYQKALADVTHEFESHDYFFEGRRVRRYAETSVVQVGSPE